jgi:protein TonB
MIGLDDSRRSERIRAAAGAALLEILLGYAIVTGLGVRPTTRADDRLRLFALAPEPPLPPPPTRVEPPRVHESKREGAASAPNIKSRATEIVVPPPQILPLAPTPVVAAPLPALGIEASSGSAPIFGPGTGSGGQGVGTGSGRGGNGEGAGGNGRGTGPKRIKGKIRDRDYPPGVGEAGIGGTVSVRYRVGVDGRVSNCVVAESSGNRDLDETTCRLITERFVFRPAKDGNGRPVPSTIEEEHSWISRPAQDDGTPRP